MVTNYPQQLTATTDIDDGTNGETMVNRACRRARRPDPVRAARTRLGAALRRQAREMRCTSCGHDTPGWDVSGRGPRQRYEGDARRHVLVPQPRLVLRKTA